MEDTVPKHPIAVVAERTGLSQDILRVWERRYRAVEPSRGAGGHRAYSDADITRLRLLHAVTNAGRSIGQVAQLPIGELSRMAQEDEAARSERANARAGGPRRGTLPEVDDLMVRALDLTSRLDGVELEHLLRRAIAQIGISAFIEDVAAPMLRRIGDNWHAGRSTIAHEHLASSTIHDLVTEAMRSMGRGSGDATVLVATPAGERHVIGAALVGAVAASDGWRVVYLGADLPASEIASATIATHARVVAMSMIYVHDRTHALAELRSLRALIPPTVAIIVGGGGARDLKDDLAALGMRVGESLLDLRNALKEVADRASSDAAKRGAA
jgi:MerR family transcriptional regulator, light-induced transcriptional regulator